MPALSCRFLAYGSRATAPNDQSGAASINKKTAPPSPLEQLLDRAAAIQVPHNWFTHFYITSVASSLYWGWSLQLWKANAQLQIVWGLMLLQGVRRLLESYTYTSSSKSTMWFAHWLLGIGFYLSINMAIWIEGPAREPTSMATALLVPAILTAHVLQHTYHAYLYRLRTENKGYQLPSHPLFPDLLCPHYTCETAIYIFMSFLSAPAGRQISWTCFCGMIFVATNLAVTANGTKNWYIEKFGKEKVGSRKRMVPWLW